MNLYYFLYRQVSYRQAGDILLHKPSAGGQVLPFR